jgi:hypothetical protein
LKLRLSLLGSFAALLGIFACGGDSPTKPPTPTPTAAATATPTATAAATATPAATAPPAEQQQPNEDEHEGPVASARTRLYVVRNRPGGDVREGPYYDPVSDTDVVRVGEFFVLDTTAFNAAGQKCVTLEAPEWTIATPGLFERLNSTNAFQLRLNARRKGVTAVYTVIDGHRSNLINIEIR